jgi:hypothetical protein
VLATLMSKTFSRLVLDAGAKAMSGQRGLPSAKGVRGLRVTALHVMHTIIDLLDPSVCIEVGDESKPGSIISRRRSASTVQMYGSRKGQVEEVFQVEG